MAHYETCEIEAIPPLRGGAPWTMRVDPAFQAEVLAHTIKDDLDMFPDPESLALHCFYECALHFRYKPENWTADYDTDPEDKFLAIARDLLKYDEGHRRLAEILILKNFVPEARGGYTLRELAKKEDLRRCYQLDFGALAQLGEDFELWAAQFSRVGGQFVVNSYLWLRTAVVPQAVRAEVAQLFLREDKEAGVCKRFSAGVKLEPPADPLVASELLYLDALHGRPLEGPDWAAERAKREAPNGPRLHEIEAGLGCSIREWVRKRLTAAAPGIRLDEREIWRRRALLASTGSGKYGVVLPGVQGSK